MPDERTYGGQDKIAGTPTKQALAGNRKVAPDYVCPTPKGKSPRGMRRGG